MTYSGCLRPCDSGPNVLGYPESVMYGGMAKADLTTIINEHLIDGNVVERIKVRDSVW